VTKNTDSVVTCVAVIAPPRLVNVPPPAVAVDL